MKYYLYAEKNQNYNDFGFFFRIIISNKSKLSQIDQTEIKSSKRLENIFSSWRRLLTNIGYLRLFCTENLISR